MKAGSDGNNPDLFFFILPALKVDLFEFSVFIKLLSTSLNST